VAAALVVTSVSAVTAAEQSPPWSAPASTTVVREEKRIHSRDADLSGTLFLPADGRALGAVVVSHGAASPLRSARLYRHLTEMLPPLGVAVFVYDRRGAGQSSGVNTGDYALLADDTIAAVRMLKADPRIDPKRIGVWGLSQGGWLSLLAAARSPEVAFAVSISAPLVPPDVQMLFRSKNALLVNGYDQTDIDQMTEARRAIDAYARGQGDQQEAQRRLDIVKTKPWFKDLYLPPAVNDRNIAAWRNEIEHEPLRTLEGVRVPVLILFGAADPEVPVAASMDRLRPLAARNPKLHVAVIADADHGMQTKVAPKDFLDPAHADLAAPDSPEYFARLTSWLIREGVARQSIGQR
jgi:hypothetical protein